VFCAILNAFRTDQVNVCEQEVSLVAKNGQDWLFCAEESPCKTDPFIEIAARVRRKVKRILIKATLRDTP
jgi:hypothetical protein